VTQPSSHFEFGKNWSDFIKRNFSEERVDVSRRHLLDFLQLQDLKGKSFLDIGCGSGLHSLAALRAGAARIFSFDYDMDSVKTTQMLRGFVGNPQYWEITQGSILDKEFLRNVEPADIVYSWGVLHHTGSMWEAMDNCVPFLKENGLLYIALYDYDIQVNPTPEFWLDVKKKYNRANWIGRRAWEFWYIWNFILKKKWWNSFALLGKKGNYTRSRGMAFYTDVVDWLGGWPMEFAKRADVKAWAERHQLAIRIMTTGAANTEYLFVKK